jgi:ADP-heptose:LPS heptosyltransferase
MNKRLLARLVNIRQSITPQEAGTRLRAAKRILLLKVDQSVSHLLAATAVISNLRRALPEARLFFLAGPHNAPAVQDHPDLDEVVVASLQGPLAPFRFLGITRRFRNEALDAALVLSTNYHTLQAAALARQCRPRFVVGLDDEPFGTNFARRGYDCVLHAPDDLKMHVVDYHLSLLEGLGMPVNDRTHRLGVTEEQRRRGGRLLEGAGLDLSRPILGAQVGGTPHDPEHQWPAAYYASILQRAAQETGFQPVILGHGADRPSIDQILALGRTPIPQLLDLPFADYKAVLSRLTFFLTHDGEPVHVAAGVGVPSFFVFLSTPPWQWAPYGSHVSVWEDFGRVPNSSEVWTRIKPLLERVG